MRLVQAKTNSKQLPWVVELFASRTRTWVEVDAEATQAMAEANAHRSSMLTSLEYRARARAVSSDNPPD